METQLHAEPPRHRWWILRVMLAAFAIVLVAAGATVAIAFNEVGKVVEALGQSDVVKITPKLLAPSSKGAPQTLLLVGNDERPPPRDNPYGQVLPHSNEMLLVRIDPSKPTISMLSIPRELQVTFTAPDGEVITNRINSAYTYGGAQLMLETIKNVFGITVNHVFITSFPKFKRAVDELGCVYMGVDRRYYHVNEPGGEQYFEINLQPGYQRLCGKQALEFVANRHEDTSLTRDARDQRFLLEVKAQYGGSLFENREKFERILGKTVETDDTLHGQEGVLDLLELLVESEGKPVRQVPFNVTLLSTYDVASEQQIQESVRSFLEGTAAIHKPTLISATRVTAHSQHASRPARVPLTPTTPAELEQARSQGPDLPFALEYPRVRDSLAAAEPDTLRVYDIHDQHGHIHPIYVVVIDRGEVGQYYDVQGTTWTDPPLLNDPGQTIHVGPRTYELFYAGERVRVIAWHEAGAVYWIENTLTNDVSPRAMLAIAEQTLPVIAASRRPMPAATRSPARNIDLAPRGVSSTSLLSAIGALLGLLGIGIVALLSLFVLARGRELSPTRAGRLRARPGGPPASAARRRRHPARRALPRPGHPRATGAGAGPARADDLPRPRTLAGMPAGRGRCSAARGRARGRVHARASAPHAGWVDGRRRRVQRHLHPGRGPPHRSRADRTAHPRGRDRQHRHQPQPRHARAVSAGQPRTGPTGGATAARTAADRRADPGPGPRSGS